jgi:hypothetical protein
VHLASALNDMHNINVHQSYQASSREVSIEFCQFGFFFFALQRLMTAFVDKLFTTKSFEAAFELVSNVDGCKDKHILMPDGVRYVIFIDILKLSSH